MKEAADREQLKRDWEELDWAMQHRVEIYNKYESKGDVMHAWWYDSELRVLVIEVNVVVPRDTMAHVFPDDYPSISEYEDAYYGKLHLEIDVTDPDIDSVCKSCIACFNELSEDRDTARYYTNLMYNEYYEWLFSDPETYGEYDAITQKGIFDAIELACMSAWRRIVISYNGTQFKHAGKMPTYQLTLK